jgi:GNAT superfamily N-acetyltransferase
VIEFRNLAAADVESILPLAREFEAAIAHPVIRMAEPAFVENWRRFIELGVGVIVAAFDGATPAGALSGYIVPCDLNGETVAQETWWFVSPAYRKSGVGRELAVRFERYAIARGARRISLGVMGHMPGAEKLLAEMGYASFETAYFKVVA